MTLDSFLKSRGYVDIPNEKVWVQKLSLHLGESRFKRFEEQVRAVHSGQLDGRNLYDTLYQRDDFHLVWSRHYRSILQAYQAVEGLLLQNYNLRESQWYDLGCGTGTFLSYLESKYQHQGVGVDTQGNALMIAADACEKSEFILWDFQKSVCQELQDIKHAYCVFGVDFESLAHLQPEGINQFAPYLGRQSELHLIRKDEAYNIWENWTSSFQTGARFVQVLRIAWFDHLIAWVDVAEEEGWSLRSISWVETQEERFPMMEWELEGDGDSDLASIPSLKEFWGREI